MDSAVIGDDLSEVFMGPDQAAYLNGEGVITALNFIGGWKSWGNRTAAYPASTDPKDTFMPTRRMFNWVGKHTDHHILAAPGLPAEPPPDSNPGGQR